MTQSFIPFNKASLTGNEINYIMESVRHGHISGDGPYTRRCNTLLEQAVGAAKALLTTSCTHALEMAAILLDLKPGDEVIVPSYTFVSTVNAFVLHGARPVFADIRPDTLNIDERQLPGLITERTRAIVPVHYAGVGCEMDEICSLAACHGVTVVEDNAHGLFGRYCGRALGSFGAMATQSFHETKNITCGEGGALLINDPQYIERAEIIREKGTNRSRFFRGQVDKYTWVDVGSSYLPSDILAAVLTAQLESAEQIQTRRRQVWECYNTRLAGWAAREGVRLPFIPDHCEQSWHMFYLICPSLAYRTSLIEHLKKENIYAVFHYVPLHTSEMGQRWGYKEGDLPVTEDLSERLVRLPLFTALTDIDLDRICAAVTAFGE